MIGPALFEQPISRRLRRVSLVGPSASSVSDSVGRCDSTLTLLTLYSLCAVRDRFWETRDVHQTGQTGRGEVTPDYISSFNWFPHVSKKQTNAQVYLIKKCLLLI